MYPTHSMSPRSTSDTPVNVIENILLFNQLGDLHMHGDFGVLDKIIVQLHIEESSLTDISTVYF